MTTLLEQDAGSLPGVASMGRDMVLVKLFDDPSNPYRIFGPVDLFEPNCFVLLPDHIADDEHPFNSYDLAYPYCRTAIRVRLDEMDPNPLLAELTALARFVSVRVLATICGLPASLASFQVVAQKPAALGPCSIIGLVHATTRQGFLVVDATKVRLPTQAAIRLVATSGETRTGWINILPPSSDSRP